MSSCSNDDKPIGEIISINEENLGEFSLKIDRVVPLETDSICVIGNFITDVAFHNDQFFLHNFMNPRNIYSFDKNGEFIFKLKKGKGPGEITYIESFTFNLDTLIVNTFTSLLYYDLQGKFYYKKQLPEGLNFRNFIYFKNNILTFGFMPSRKIFQSFRGIKDGTNKKFIDFYKENIILYKKYDTSFDQEIDTYIPAKGDYDGLSMNPISKYKDHLLLLEPPANYIYYYDGEQMVNAYTIDFGDKNFEEKEFKLGIEHNMSKIREGKKWGFITSINETRNYISFGFGRVIKDVWTRTECVYSKNTKKYFFLNDLLDELDLVGVQIMGTYKNQFICMVKPYDLSEKGWDYLTKEYALAEPITENSNPVILFVTVTE